MMLRSVLTRRDESPITLADRALRDGEMAAALELYRTALARNPARPEIWMQCGHILMAAERFWDAEVAYRRAVSYAPDNAEALLHLGSALKRQGRSEEAQRQYLRSFALNASPETARELENAGWKADHLTLIRETAGDMSEAVRAQAADKRKRTGTIARADLARDMGNWAEAARLYRKALDRHPHNPPIWVQYGHALKECGRLAEAERAYRNAVYYDPGSAEWWLQLGHCLKMRSDTEQAEAAFLRAISLNPGLTDALVELGRLGCSPALLDAIVELNREAPDGQNLSLPPSGHGLTAATEIDVAAPMTPAVPAQSGKSRRQADLKFRIVPYYIDPQADHRPPPGLFPAKIGIHLHLFYDDMLDDLISRLSAIPAKFDLYVSLPQSWEPSHVAEIERLLRQSLQNMASVVIVAVPNRGRDIAPLLVEFSRDLLSYDIVGHFHTKKSTYNPDLKDWGKDIFDLLLGPAGSSGDRVYSIFRLLSTRAKIVYPEGNLAIPKEPSGWAGNYDLARAVLERYTEYSIADFPVVQFAEGTMFWARSEAIADFLSLPFAYDDFPEEPIPPDGTLAHTLERLLFIMASRCDGDLIRLHRGDSITDYSHYEHQQDHSLAAAQADVKILSYYLPQFYPIPENDLWHGAGFTEWTKVRSANPLFEGHYQQHIPHPDLGYYSLASADQLKLQAEMMRKSGVYGQIFYHYWFDGKVILDNPAKLLLSDPGIEMPFCFCWANENWTRRWDGSEHDILLEQRYSRQDARAFIRYLLPFFQDSRYIRVANRPMLFVYRPSSIPIIRDFLEIWREECIAAGLEPVYAVAVLAAGARDPRDFAMDAGAERALYDWTAGRVAEITPSLEAYTDIRGRVYSYADIKEFYCNEPQDHPFTCFRSLLPGWDNTPRYHERAFVVHGSTPAHFQEWLEELIRQAQRKLPADRRFVLINAWNEWAEGAHLEPDTRFGYAYLNAIGRALSKTLPGA